MKLRNVFKHFKLITIHRWYVFLNCCKAGMPIRGLCHDLSKYSPTEFWESVKYFQGNRSPIDACKEVNGYSVAWMHHKGRNPHHYEHWQDNFDKGGQAVQMPFKYALELVCDYLAAGRAYMKKDFSYIAEYDWWCGKKKNPIVRISGIKCGISGICKISVNFCMTPFCILMLCPKIIFSSFYCEARPIFIKYQ